MAKLNINGAIGEVHSNIAGARARPPPIFGKGNFIYYIVHNV